jgi:multicomponent Na+:H+ antiporter subunit B
VLIYGGTGVANILLGHDFLDYGSFNPEHAEHGQHYGILIVELGVGVTVASTMALIFFALAGRTRSEDAS